MMITIPPTFLERLDAVIENNLGNEDLSTDQLAEQLCMSSSQVYRKIKQQTGNSPSVYIRQKRLENSLYLVQKSDLNISEIAYLVGFSCLSYFSKCFSEYYGYPPSQIRT